ncbi:MAG: hypothetical protein FWE02_06880 [Defluviitaleaceae bacterium]|nr:hypothetical protein [Defluviitaleaceae bacterium]
MNTKIEIHYKKEKTEKIHTRNLEIYEAQNKENFTPKQMHYYARKLKEHQQWEEATEWFERFLETESWASF